MRRDYWLKQGSSWQRVSKIVAIMLSEDGIIDLRVLDGFCWCGVSTTGFILLEDFYKRFNFLFIVVGYLFDGTESTNTRHPKRPSSPFKCFFVYFFIC